MGGAKRAVKAWEGLPEAEKGLRAIKTRVLLANRSNFDTVVPCFSIVGNKPSVVYTVILSRAFSNLHKVIVAQ